MAQAHYLPEADDALVRIAKYIAKDNPAAALRWLDEMQAACELLAEQPGIGQRTKTKRFGEVRRHVAGNYWVYYRPVADGVEILFVEHQARQQERLL